MINNSTNSPRDLFTAKIFIIGNFCVGKTSLITRYWEETFLPDTRELTIDYKFKTNQEKRIRLHVWDTGGQERFKSVSPRLYKGCKGIIFCYAVNDKESFEKLDDWMREVKKNGGNDACQILIATKNDLPDEDRVVERAEGEKKAKEWGIKFFEISSKENIGVTEAIEYLTEEIRTKKADGNNTNSNNQSEVTRLSIAQSTNEKTKKGSCC